MRKFVHCGCVDGRYVLVPADAVAICWFVRFFARTHDSERHEPTGAYWQWKEMLMAKSDLKLLELDYATEGEANCKALGQIFERIGDKWTIMIVGARIASPSIVK